MEYDSSCFDRFVTYVAGTFCNPCVRVGHFNLWWSRWDSNPRPPRCHRGALPTAPRPHRIDSAMLAFARWPRPSGAANQLLSPHSKRLLGVSRIFQMQKKVVN